MVSPLGPSNPVVPQEPPVHYGHGDPPEEAGVHRDSDLLEDGGGGYRGHVVEPVVGRVPGRDESNELKR